MIIIEGPEDRPWKKPRARPVVLKAMQKKMDSSIIFHMRVVNLPATADGSVNRAITMTMPTILTNKTMVNAGET